MTDQETNFLRENIRALIAEEHATSMEDLLSDPDSEGEFGLASTFFARLLENYVHLEFTEEEAITHWHAIVENSFALKEKLGRPIGIHLAVVDYFTNLNHVFSSPMLVEVHVFRQAERLAMIDGLTGIFNRRYMDIILKKEFNRCDRYSKALSVCILDIDDFKAVNDTRGHVFGDQVLKELASLLRESVRDEDIACRYGGEEFLVILPETDTNGALVMANRLRSEMKKRIFFRDNGITFSAGTATYPVCAKELISLIQAADHALYEAKANGKDCVIPANIERRKFGRYSKPWTLTIYSQDGDRQISGIVTQNISLGGIQFECPVRYDIDTLLRLVFTNPDGNYEQIEVEGHITWVRKNRASYSYGVSFISIPETFEMKLAEPQKRIAEPIEG
jgi:diguanylate cyclase (GGDEF)-like protein